MANFFILLSSGDSFMGFISQPWHWSISGLMIALILFLMTWMGRSFGVSTSFKALCSVAGAGRKVPFFNINIKEEHWRFAFVIGGIIGAIFASNFLQSPEAVNISTSTRDFLSGIGLNYPQVDATGQGFLPTEIFNLGSLKGVLLALLGGYFVGFGARYGDGCTSGHAISGLAHLQIPSLLTVIGFFIGGLIMAHFILPHLITL